MFSLEQKREYYHKLRLMVIKALGGKCVECGETNPTKLCIHEVHGKKHPYNIDKYHYYEDHIVDFEIRCIDHHKTKHKQLREEKRMMVKNANLQITIQVK